MQLAARLTFPSATHAAAAGGLQSTVDHERWLSRRNRRWKRPPNSCVQVCTFWMEGRCTRRSCPYLHPPNKHPQQQRQQQKKTNAYADLNAARPPQTISKRWSQQINAAHVPNVHHGAAVPSPKQDLAADDDLVSNHHNVQEEQQPAFITNLTGHNGAVTGITLPFSSQMLFSIGDDATLRAWDCKTGLCGDVLHFAHAPSCLFNSFADPNWLFVGLPNEVRVCNLSTHTQQALAVTSPVLSLSSVGDLLVAGLQEGLILVWRFEPSSASFHPLKCLSTRDPNNPTASPVLCLEPSNLASSGSASVMYAGSLDGIIRVWDLASGCCLHAWSAHSKQITGLLAYDHTSLLSASEDGAIKLWKLCEGDEQLVRLQSTFVPAKQKPEDAADATPLALCGTMDEADKPILFAAYSDNSVHIMEVPSFKSKGTLTSINSPIQAMDTGAGNLLFLGSNRGDISVWKWK